MHTGDQAEEIAEFLYYSFTVLELEEHYGGSLERARAELLLEVQQWPEDKIHTTYDNLFKGENPYAEL